VEITAVGAELQEVETLPPVIVCCYRYRRSICISTIAVTRLIILNYSTSVLVENLHAYFITTTTAFYITANNG
jgi:hypothetical protein